MSRSDIIEAEPAESNPIKFRGRMVLTPWAGMVAVPWYNRSPARDRISIFRFAGNPEGFCRTNRDRQPSGLKVSVKSG